MCAGISEVQAKIATYINNCLMEEKRAYSSIDDVEHKCFSDINSLLFLFPDKNAGK